MAVLNDEQVMLRDMAREWVDHESPVTAFRRVRDAAPSAGFDVAVASQQAEMGWFGITVPEAYGGSAFGFVSLGLVVEQLGRTLSATPLPLSAVAAAVIAEGGSDEVKQAWLPRLATGEVTATLALDEGAVPGRVATTMSDGKLSGTKTFVPEAASAELFLVAAVDGLYLAEDGDGVSKAPRQLIDSRSHVEITFTDAPATCLGGMELTERARDLAAVVATAEMLGMAEQAFQTTLAYLKTRVQFGQVLSTFQALQHRMARMLAELELMRSVVENALAAADGGGDLAEAASLAKAVAGETLNLVSREMIQLHGGIGMTDEHDAGLYMKRARVLEASWGNAAWHRERFARINGY